MRTLITDSTDEAAEIVRRGGLVAFPTETVYGLGADVFNESALRRIFEAKQRPPDNPLIIHIADISQIGELAEHVTDKARKLIEAFFPGPLTVVVKKCERVSKLATAGLDTVGIRMPSFPRAHEFLLKCETPVAAPSANVSGRPSPTTWQAVREDLDGRIDCILRGDPTEIGLESTVVDCSDDIPVILRRGSVTMEMLRRIVPDITAAAGSEELRRSPGIRHKHYAPRAVVELVKTPPEPRSDAAFIGLSTKNDGWGHSRYCRDIEEYAREVFEFFRECDRRGIATVYCQSVGSAGIGEALMDRLRRAAER
ncbi:MAG: threonylcarbamoyl-AMP synthase [Acidobacteriota bacterium]|nr:MAG: threonylcarbamoyl-AMP synthase [Acidobacteriota bacterium]